MSNYVYLLSPTRLKQDSIACDNIDDKYAINAIKTAQDIQLTELIGSKLVKKVQQLIADKQINKEGHEDYKELLDSYIIPFLVMQTTAELIMPIQFKLRNAGLTQSADTQTQYATLEESQYISQHYQNKARFYGERMKDFAKNFSEYVNTCSCDGDVKPGKYRVNITL